MNKKRVLVTGGSRGIGRGIVLAFAAEGCDVVFSYATKSDEANELVNIIKTNYGVKAACLQANLEKPGVAKNLVNEAIDILKGIDVLVNNAGRTIFEDILNMKEETMQLLIDLDFKAYLLTTQAAAKYMIENNIKGSIINITSSRGERSYPRDAVYGGIKAAIERATESIALDLAPYGIRANCIAPGLTRVRIGPKFYEDCAPKIPLERVGEPEDIGNAAVWLASEKASYITGVTLRIDGGLILPGMPEMEIEGAELRGWRYIKK